MTDEQRGTGQTTRQMLEAPPNAAYVWCNWRLHYPTTLARFLGRTDLKIIPGWAPDVIRALQDHRRIFVIDHAADLPGQVRGIVESFNEQRRRWQ